MKLLYVASGHPLQEADDCLMWDKLGIEWFSTGYYAHTDNPGDLPYINMSSMRNQFYEEFKSQYGVTNGGDEKQTLCGQKNYTWTNQVIKNIWKFNQRFLDNFDAILFNYFAYNVQTNWKNCRRKKIYLKTYGMHPIEDENTILGLRKKGIKIIRNSPSEHLRCRTFGGFDQIIRGSVVKDEYEISGWTGEEKKVCTFTSYLLRDSKLPVDQARKLNYMSIVDRCKYKCDLYGIGNNFITHNDKLSILKNYRVNLVTGTPNANNTYSFVEAWVMGQPVVVFGPSMWAGSAYEVDKLVKHGVDGFIANTPDECVEYINLLMEDYTLAKVISDNARDKAVSIYGRDVLSIKWKDMFKKDGLI